MALPSHPSRGSKRGFTLVELAVVMVVVSILAGVAVASLSGLTSSRQNVAATRIRTAMIYAQEWAMDSSNDTWVAFDVSGDVVSVFVEDPLNPGVANRLALADPLTRSAMTIQAGVDGASIDSADFDGTGELHFDSTGIPHDAAGNVLVTDGTVDVSGGITIRVTKNTGLVTID